MLDQRRRRWADVVQMLYKCFLFAGVGRMIISPLLSLIQNVAYGSILNAENKRYDYFGCLFLFLKPEKDWHRIFM